MRGDRNDPAMKRDCIGGVAVATRFYSPASDRMTVAAESPKPLFRPHCLGASAAQWGLAPSVPARCLSPFRRTAPLALASVAARCPSPFRRPAPLALDIRRPTALALAIRPAPLWRRGTGTERVLSEPVPVSEARREPPGREARPSILDIGLESRVVLISRWALLQCEPGGEFRCRDRFAPARGAIATTS